MSWNPGPRRGTPGAIEKHIAGKVLTIAFQEAIEYLKHDSLTNSFHVSHYAGCAVLFNKDTLYPDVRVSSVYINDTKNGLQQVVREGEAGWVFLAAVSRAAFRRVPRNSKPFFTMMSLRINNHYAKRRGIAKNVFYLQSVLFCVRNKLMWLLRCEGKTVMINSAAARSRVRAPTRTNQSHTAVHHCGDQVAFQENGPTYVDPSSRRIQTVSGRYVATPRSK